MAHPKILAFVLAGGKGERLFPLTSFRSKPSVPFGGQYRIVDFVLSNLVNSHVYSIYLLVQYKSQSLIDHVRKNWVLSSVIKDHFVTVVPPQMRMGPEWFQGTADAVFQNIGVMRELNPELVIIFGADHVYRMDVRQMIDFHIKNNAVVTVAARPVPIELASSFGVIVTDSEKRIIGFQEKPKKPIPMTDNPKYAYVSMGNYIFNKDVMLGISGKGPEGKNSTILAPMSFRVWLRVARYSPTIFLQISYRGPVPTKKRDIGVMLVLFRLFTTRIWTCWVNSRSLNSTTAYGRFTTQALKVRPPKY